MNTKYRLVMILVFALGMLLAACSSSTPAPATEAPAYPGPEAYPAPARMAEPVYNPYPGPSEGVTNYVEWAAAETAILDGQVDEAFQAATLHVTLVLKDGSVMLAKEPATDEVVKVIERCGDACQGLEVTNQ